MDLKFNLFLPSKSVAEELKCKRCLELWALVDEKKYEEVEELLKSAKYEDAVNTARMYERRKYIFNVSP